MLDVIALRPNAEAASLIKTTYCEMDITYFRRPRKRRYLPTVNTSYAVLIYCDARVSRTRGLAGAFPDISFQRI